eukprot:339772-Chlamydomonas_euryale.AAC.2
MGWDGMGWEKGGWDGVAWDGLRLGHVSVCGVDRRACECCCWDIHAIACKPDAAADGETSDCIHPRVGLPPSSFGVCLPRACLCAAAHPPHPQAQDGSSHAQASLPPSSPTTQAPTRPRNGPPNGPCAHVIATSSLFPNRTGTQRPTQRPTRLRVRRFCAASVTHTPSA